MPYQVALRLALSAAMANAPQPDEPVRAELVVDADALGDPAPAIQRQLQSRGERVLRDAEVLPAASDDDARIEVDVEPLPDDAGFRCKLRVVRGGEVVQGTSATTECRLCTDDELAQQVGEAIERVVARIEPEVAEATSDQAESDVPPPVVAAPVDADGGWRLGTMGKAGVGLSVGGAAAFGLGMGFAVAPLLVRQTDGRSGQSVALAGTAVAIVGGAALVSGVVLMLVERKRSRSRRATANRRGGVGAALGLRVQPAPALAWH